MKFSENELKKIEEESLFFYERIFSKNISDEKKANADDIIKKWSQTLAKENITRLQRRFEWDDLSIDNIKKAIANKIIIKNSSPWTKTLNEVVESLETLKKTKVSYLEKDKKIPFEDFLKNFVEFASDKLNKKHDISLLSKKALDAFKRSLLTKLSEITAQALNKEFFIDKYLEFGSDLSASDLSGSNQSAMDLSTRAYDAFIENMIQNNALVFFKDYPVCARLLANTIDLWIENTCIFLKRLKSDLPEIQDTFFDGNKVSKISEITANISDSHDRGKAVFIITFDNLEKLVYKPKDMEVDVAYFEFCKWINKNSNFLDYKILKVIPKKDYGWMEYVNHNVCQSSSEIKNYYQRTGNLLCLLKVLNGCDFHLENILASKDFPIPIDLETLLQPHSVEMDDTVQQKDNPLSNSVISLLMLPFGDLQANKGYDLSGITGEYSKSTKKMFQWKNVNTDAMIFAEDIMINKNPSISTNIPYLKDIMQTPQNYLNDISIGYEKAHNFFYENKAFLLSDKSPLKMFENCKLRFIMRPTMTYALALKNAMQSEYLHDGISFSIILDKLARPLLFYQNKPTIWPIIKDEQKAFYDLDIPKFVYSSSSTDVELMEGESFTLYKYTGMEKLKKTIIGLNEKDLHLQLQLINLSLKAKYLKVNTKGKNKQKTGLKANNSKILSDVEFKKIAKKIADDLVDNSITNEDLSTWIQIDMDPINMDYNLQETDDYLYSGKTGIAIFLAAAGKIFKEKKYIDIALKAIAPVRDFMKLGSFKFHILNKGIGLSSGISALIYSFVKISELTNDKTLLDDAVKLSALVDEDLLKKDSQLDLLGGAAGGVLALCNLYKVTKNKDVLEKAKLCAEHLLNNRSLSDTNHLVWNTIDTHILGFSHGASGISYALFELYKYTQDKKHFDAAKIGIDFENANYCEKAKNWPDLRIFPELQKERKKKVFACQWCHGASGVALGRLGAIDVYDNDLIQRDILASIETTEKSSFEFDHLCCGGFGKIETFIESYLKLNDANHLKTAKKFASYSIEKAKRDNGFTFFSDIPKDLPVYSFFRGTAGVGYQLLRLVHPKELPSILSIK
jgi:type 2 lantibiotic biosynthesis protein LanM